MRLRAFLTPVAVFGIASTLGVAALAPKAETSSHREAPAISSMPAVDNTDVWAFRSPDAPDTMTLIANWIPFEEPSGGPNFYHFDDSARYNIKLDTDGDGNADITYRWTFRTDLSQAGPPLAVTSTFLYNTAPLSPTYTGNPNFIYRQYYTVTEQIGAGAAVPIVSNKLMVPDNVGPRSTPNYPALANEAIVNGTFPGSTDKFKEFTGQRADMFFVDVGSIFDLGGLRPLNGFYNPALGVLPPAPGIDSLKGFNAHTTSLQVPIARVLAGRGCTNVGSDKKCVVGVWSTADKPAPPVAGVIYTPGSFVQVSRLGNPLVNEVVIDLQAKDVFNSINPSQDTTVAGTGAGPRVIDPYIVKLLPVLYPAAFPNAAALPAAPRNDLVAIFLTGIDASLLGGALTTQQTGSAATPSEQLRLNLGIAPTAGVCQGKIMGLLDSDLAGFPNGRRLEDDVTDIALRAVAGGTAFQPTFNKFPNNALTDGVQKPQTNCLPAFPYQGTPSDGYYRQHANLSTNTVPISAVQAQGITPTSAW